MTEWADWRRLGLSAILHSLLLLLTKDCLGSDGLHHGWFGWPSSWHQAGDPPGQIGLAPLLSSIRADLKTSQVLQAAEEEEGSGAKPGQVAQTKKSDGGSHQT